MKIGFIGLGKLGLPCALAIENKGHEVIGTDVDEKVRKYLAEKEIPYLEEGTPELLKKTKIKFATVGEVVQNSEIVFCAVQTPHHPEYEGITRIPKRRVDFDYSYLKIAVNSIAQMAEELEKEIILVIISTVLPGTVESQIKRLLNKHVKLVYNPFFIAMGTTRYDFENPEFVLLGCDDEVAADKVEKFYGTIHKKPVFRCSVASAELIKVAYNTFISGKIAFINTMMEICEKTQADIDDVSNALAFATDRIISPKYLRGGMGDGGGCHPRDNIALSWLSRYLNLKFDWFDAVMMQREKQTEWLADLIQAYKDEFRLPVIICGRAFKRGTNLEVGSPAVLLANILRERNITVDWYDPHVYPGVSMYKSAALYFIGCNHKEFETLKFPKGSVVIDPWGMVKDQKEVWVKRLGRKS